MPPKGAILKKRPAAARSEEEQEEEDEEEQEEEVAESAPPTPPLPLGRGRGGARGRVNAASTSSGAAAAPTPEAATPEVARQQRDEVPASPASSVSRAKRATGSIGGDRPAIVKQPEKPTGPRTLQVPYDLPDGVAGPEALGQGLVRLRRANQLCDTVVVSGGGRIPVHRVVLAAQSDVFAVRLQGNESAPPMPGSGGEAVIAEVDLRTASYEAVDLVVRFLYGEVAEESYSPSNATANEEILKLASELGLPRLAELCALQLAADADVSNVVARVRLCEKFGLPRLRGKLLTAIVEDGHALGAVANDAATLTHPALMRELLAAIAVKANESEEDNSRVPKKMRIRA